MEALFDCQKIIGVAASFKTAVSGPSDLLMLAAAIHLAVTIRLAVCVKIQIAIVLVWATDLPYVTNFLPFNCQYEIILAIASAKYKISPAFRVATPGSVARVGSSQSRIRCFASLRFLAIIWNKSSHTRATRSKQISHHASQATGFRRYCLRSFHFSNIDEAVHRADSAP
jgi:hypothetical protein